jgi:hypothetical protein
MEVRAILLQDVRDPREAHATRVEHVNGTQARIEIGKNLLG